MTIDFEALRRRFPVLERKTYLNSGSYCALADTVRDAFNAYMDDRLAVGANWDVWITKNEAVRAAMAGVLRVTPDEIAVTASASAGINALASALDFTGPQRKVVVTGLGATTPLAGDLPGSWQAALEGRSGARTITEDWVERYELPVTFAAQLLSMLNSAARPPQLAP